ncbi:chaplin [Streptomyces sp. NPDC029674]|uniref:chaplin n=1 Tax=Streptomyces sp. NPDC029674 TaxID=3365297 RepID=UPI00384E2A72
MRMRTILTAGALAGVIVTGGAGTAMANPDPGADAKVHNSPGILSGNAVQVPVDLGLNVCGNTIDVLGLLNPADGNKCKAD